MIFLIYVKFKEYTERKRSNFKDFQILKRLLVRRMGEVDAILALFRETDETGIIYETDISEYPIMYGY